MSLDAGEPCPTSQVSLTFPQTSHIAQGSGLGVAWVTILAFFDPPSLPIPSPPLCPADPFPHPAWVASVAFTCALPLASRKFSVSPQMTSVTLTLTWNNCECLCNPERHIKFSFSWEQNHSLFMSSLSDVYCKRRTQVLLLFLCTLVLEGGGKELNCALG